MCGAPGASWQAPHGLRTSEAAFSFPSEERVGIEPTLRPNLCSPVAPFTGFPSPDGGAFTRLLFSTSSICTTNSITFSYAVL